VRRFGLRGHTRATLEEIGRELGITREAGTPDPARGPEKILVHTGGARLFIPGAVRGLTRQDDRRPQPSSDSIIISAAATRRSSDISTLYVRQAAAVSIPSSPIP